MMHDCRIKKVNRNFIAYDAKNMCFLTFYRESLPTLDLHTPESILEVGVRGNPFNFYECDIMDQGRE